MICAYVVKKEMQWVVYKVRIETLLRQNALKACQTHEDLNQL